MKILKEIFVLLFFFVFLIISTACDKNEECKPQNPTCYEQPPTNEECLAVFSSWFYNEKTNSCEELGYSDCNKYGFETKEECEECRCK